MWPREPRGLTKLIQQVPSRALSFSLQIMTKRIQQVPSRALSFSLQIMTKWIQQVPSCALSFSLQINMICVTCIAYSEH